MDRIVSISDLINPKERRRILEVLSHYSIIPEKVEKIRSVYKVKCGNRYYCLKKTKNGDKKAKKGMYLVEYLKSNGFYNVAEYIKTEEGREYFKTQKNTYYLMEWIDGRECDVENFEELKTAVKMLAEFHIKSKGFSPEGVRVESNIKNWPVMLQTCKKDLDLFKHLIERKKVQTSFDIDYYSYIEKFKSSMDTAIDLLKKSNYMIVSSRAKNEKCICHDSFYYQNILFDPNNNVYLIDLDSTIYDIHVYDLAKFIRRILYKKIYCWNFEIARKLIDVYCSVNPLSIEDYEILLAFIIFPHKYWKLGRKRYIKKKKWSEDKYLKKLRKLVRYIDRQQHFINCFIDYYKINM
ncbi:CotS family spore coat protein [Fonticella tunisiensis]|uniref:CotS family spore coat protein n=1 Tax=Fonticella tunisiensis TaxID=1096341 RepID=A0A4R7KU68_9CLOT|nr:CotS family spore coat protein [Fonticella tunisiensis]TDT61519.1 CotS family spore coat protein [Fonticella tunisiensis]